MGASLGRCTSPDGGGHSSGRQAVEERRAPGADAPCSYAPNHFAAWISRAARRPPGCHGSISWRAERQPCQTSGGACRRSVRGLLVRRRRRDHLRRALRADRARPRARALGLRQPVTQQPQYSLIVREIEWEVVPAALDAGMGLLPWSPLGGGWLSGKYRRDERPTGDTRLGDDPNRGMEAYDRRGSDRTWRVIDVVQQVADARGVSMAEVALSWVTDRPAVTSTILGARTTEQLRTNLASADLELSDDERAALDDASDLGATDYPYGEMGVDQRSRELAGG
ncbi:aldo/keto reductase [Phycicoccus sp. HDW14]|nr:aldo/keto reductase [Phycicoccus sp. HDW14]